MLPQRITVLLVDDDPEIAQVVVNYLPPERYRVEVVGDGALVLSTVRHLRPDVILLDVHLPSTSGLELLRQLKVEAESIPVIIVSGYVSTGNAIEAMQQGAFEYLTKPFRLEALEKTIVRACGRAAGPVPRSDADVAPAAGQIIGKTPEIVAVAKVIGKVADSDVPLLLMGESGTGKELVARSLHQNSSRRHKPFLIVCCAASTESFLESELFGDSSSEGVSGRPQRPGKLDEADGGTLFLDEVADLPLLLQSRLFQVLDEGVRENAVDGRKIPSRVRIIAATSHSLVDLMKEGRFRVDLYYQLKVVTLFLPPLRERRADIPLLCDYFVRKYSRRAHCPPKPLSAAATDRLLRYHWPGNVRELDKAVHTAVVLSREAELKPEDFSVLGDERPQSKSFDSGRRDYADLFRHTLEPVFRDIVASSEGRVYAELTAALDEALVEAALEVTHQNQVRAAQMLGISRNTLRERIRRFSLVAR